MLYDERNGIVKIEFEQQIEQKKTADIKFYELFFLAPEIIQKDSKAVS